MASCLVTGGAGLIGAHLVRALSDRGHDVVAVDDLSTGRRENIDARAAFVKASVADHEAIEQLFASHRFACVFHLAAYGAQGLSHFIKRFTYTNNVIGSVNLINSAVNHDVECFVFTSSIAVYGVGRAPMTEDLPALPVDPYGIAKRAVELELAVSRDLFGLDYVIFRPHNVYGEMQDVGDRYRNVLAVFMNKILRDEPLPIFGDGGQTRAFTYVGDIVDAIAAAPWTPGARGETFNIGSDRPYTVNVAADVVRAAMGVPDHPVVHHDRRPGATHAFCDHSKLTSVFGRGPSTPLAEGVARMAAWARENGSRSPSSFTGIEITKNLPSAWR